MIGNLTRKTPAKKCGTVLSHRIFKTLKTNNKKCPIFLKKGDFAVPLFIQLNQLPTGFSRGRGTPTVPRDTQLSTFGTLTINILKTNNKKRDTCGTVSGTYTDLDHLPLCPLGQGVGSVPGTFFRDNRHG